MFKRSSLLIVLLFALALFPFAHKAHAQVSDQISVSVNPVNPGPNQTVTVTLTSYAFSLQTAEIQWTATGQNASSGIGQTKYSFVTKSLGTPTTVNVTVTPVGSIAIQKSVTVTPMMVDMLWEANDAIVPPFYRGKAMPTSESTVKFVAIPQIKSASGAYLAPSSFDYTWSENYTADQDDSGFGKNGYQAFMDYLNPDKYVSVDVSSQDGTLATSGNVTVSPTDPKIVWYAASPLYGPLYDSALTGSYTVVGSDTSLIAEPYFFSPGTPLSKSLTYDWKINDNDVDVPSIPNSLFLHRDSSQTGTASVSVEITNAKKLFQDVTSSLNLSLQ